MLPSWVILAYFGPETVLPITSVLATIAGLVMMFGRSLFAMLLLPFKRKQTLETRDASPIRSPHFSSRDTGSKAKENESVTTN